MKTIAITGASGFIGCALITALLERGDRVIALSRTPNAGDAEDNLEQRRFDPNDSQPNPAAFEGADAVVHLAGEPVAGRWTSEKKQRIGESRIVGTQHVIASMARCASPPRILVNASATGYYGSRGDEPLFEQRPAGSDFLANTCIYWEAAAREAERSGVRVVMMRIGIVLGNGGALKEMTGPYAFGAGGPLGSGTQFVPWIHVADLAQLFIHAIDRDDIRGPINAVTPDYATSTRFANAIGAALRRPSLIPAPAFALRAILGEFATVLLTSQLVIPARAQDTGFIWKHPQLESAMHAILGKNTSAKVQKLEATQIVAAGLPEVFAFFADAANLERITPPLLHFRIKSGAGAIERGSIIQYALRLRGLPIGWKTLIAEWTPLKRFVDVQLHGPYTLWNHEHDFREVDGGVEIRDTVSYLLPLPPLSNIALGLVRRDVEAIFQFRRAAIAQHFG